MNTKKLWLLYYHGLNNGSKDRAKDMIKQIIEKHKSEIQELVYELKEVGER